VASLFPSELKLRQFLSFSSNAPVQASQLDSQPVPRKANDLFRDGQKIKLKGSCAEIVLKVRWFFNPLSDSTLPLTSQIVIRQSKIIKQGAFPGLIKEPFSPYIFCLVSITITKHSFTHD
jgi:hypothetical protein